VEQDALPTDGGDPQSAADVLLSMPVLMDGAWMPAPSPLPVALDGRVFTRAEALAHGLTLRMLDSQRIVAMQRGVYRYARTPVNLRLLATAALRVLPAGAALSHVTALQLRGLDVGPSSPIHISTNQPTQRTLRGVFVHRRRGRLHPTELNDLPVLRPDRTFVDAATQLHDRELLRVGDWLVATGRTDVETLRTYVFDSHLDGVQRARRIAMMVRAGAASPRESDLRWEIVRAGLPEPELNVDIIDELGEFIARGDLVYRRWMVVVEYDGWQHDRDAWQRQYDHLRRERLEGAGWRVIVITAADFRHPMTLVRRIEMALRQRGFAA
jgi:very-short-patch-repair endonuclease